MGVTDESAERAEMNAQAAVQALARGLVTALARNIAPGSTAGLPCLVLPAGRTRAGLPVSLELDGRLGADRLLLGIGLALEEVLGCWPAPAVGAALPATG